MQKILVKAKKLFNNQKFYLGLLVMLSLPSLSYGKPSSQLRGFFNALHLNFSIGYGISSYQTQIEGYKAFFKDGQLYLQEPSKGPQTAYLVQWYGKPYIRKHCYHAQKALVYNTAQLTYDGIGHMLPFTLSIHGDIKRKLRLEIGGSFCINKIEELTPNEKNKNFGTYCDPVGTHYATKIFVSLGHKLMENTFCTLLLNTQFSYDFIYNDIFKDDYAVAANYWSPALGLGLTFEKHISEYVSFFSKITYEKVNFVDQLSVDTSGVINSDRDNVLFQIGLTLTCGEIPMCPVPHCKVEGKHNHGEKTYRGVSIEVGKNSKGYKLYKK
jgi:hypothetical protein